MENQNQEMNGASVAVNEQQPALKRTLSEENSKKINALRIILMLLVMFGHNNYKVETVGADMIFNQSVFGKWVQLLISDGIARGAVPVFFITSAFLLFFKHNPYPVLLKKKSKSLLLPFLLWPVVNMLFYALLKLAGDLTGVGFLSGIGNYDFLQWSFKEWFGCFFGYVGDGVLYLSHFWFLRDLIVLTILSPVIEFIYEKAKFLFIVFIVYTEFIGFYPYIVMPESLFYFSLGMIFAKDDIDFFGLVKKLHWYEVIPVFLVLWFVFWKFQAPMPTATLMLMAFADAVMLLKFSEILIKNEKVYSVLAYLAKYSFFLYAVHIKILRSIIRTVWVRLLPMTNGFMCLAEYFGVTILMAACGIGLGIALKKICPKLFDLLNGR